MPTTVGMMIKTFSQSPQGIQSVEVEVALWPGLPQIQFIGLPDQQLKESALRIKSALKSSGFEFPTAQQIVVNLKPSDLRKSGRGIELAVALAYLAASGQWTPPKEKILAVGGLSLFGEVEAAPELLHGSFEDLVVASAVSDSLEARWLPLKTLSDLKTAVPLEACGRRIEWKRPREFKHFKFSSVEAEFLMITALGRHHALMAGAAGAGKTTLAQVIRSLQPEPSKAEGSEIAMLHPSAEWRPLIQPHHTIPLAAMIGGGRTPVAGEMALAHRGILFLDELLEFDRRVLEALREPFEQGVVRVSRLFGRKSFEVRPQILASTNLCPCGKYTPDRRNFVRCRFSLLRCRSYSQRLSGPLVDRFQVLYYPGPVRDRSIPWTELLDRVLKAQEYRERHGLTEVGQRLTPEAPWILEDLVGSQRRVQATLAVAATLADLGGSEKVLPEHLQGARRWTERPFDQMDQLFG